MAYLFDPSYEPRVAEAFTPRWLGERYDVAKQELEVFTALRLVRAAGGVAVLANSRRGDRVVPDELIAQLADAGLFGLEADHPEHDTATRAQVRARAANLGLVVTGSSDFHGAAKTVSLAANTTDPQVYERILAAPTGAAGVHLLSGSRTRSREQDDLAPGEEGRRRRCLWSS